MLGQGSQNWSVYQNYLGNLKNFQTLGHMPEQLHHNLWEQDLETTISEAFQVMLRDFVGQFKILFNVFLFCLKTQLSRLCLVDYHLSICVQVPKFYHSYLLSFFSTVCLCICHFTNPFTIILMGFKEGAEGGVQERIY